MKTVALVSGGIDSPVALYLTVRKGHDVVAVHMDNRPFSDEYAGAAARDAVEQVARITATDLKYITVAHGHAQRGIMDKCRANLQCVLCKRFMLRAAERVAISEGADVIIMGDSLGQVASQTLANIRVIESAVKMPVVRPLIGMDKIDIIEIARKIGTYEISTAHKGICRAVPDKPATCADISSVIEEEKKPDLTKMLNTALSSTRVEYIRSSAEANGKVPEPDNVSRAVSNQGDGI